MELKFVDVNFADVMAGGVVVDGYGIGSTTVCTRGVVIPASSATISVATHPHTDHLVATSTVITPREIAGRVYRMYRERSLMPKIVSWGRYEKTYHYNRGVRVFSSAMAFSDFAVIGESAEQKGLVKKYARQFSNGVVVKTPRLDTFEDAEFSIPPGWLLAGSNDMPRAMPTLRDMDLSPEILEVVKMSTCRGIKTQTGVG